MIMQIQERQPSIEEMRTCLLAKLKEDPHRLYCALGPALQPVIDSSNFGGGGVNWPKGTASRRTRDLLA